LLSTFPHAAGGERLLPFRRNQVRDAAELAYRLVVEQARRPEFFTRFGVPDTLDGRFELICLHAFLYLRRLKSDPSAASVAQRFYDTMFADFDRSLREMGIGDLSVGKQVKRMTRAFYGRILAYEKGLAGNDAMLAAAVARNLLGTVAGPARAADATAAYIRDTVEELRRQSAAKLLAGHVSFETLGGRRATAPAHQSTKLP
jgi:cytochrome b pre-mRNA-processing protein 3